LGSVIALPPCGSLLIPTRNQVQTTKFVAYPTPRLTSKDPDRNHPLQ
jgi:hypothetical protein